MSPSDASSSQAVSNSQVPPGDVVLEARGLTVGYGALAAVRNVELRLRRGEIVALLGANGAGKTTTIRGLAGVLQPMSGEVIWLGVPTRAPLYRRARGGLAYVSEQRALFMTMSVRDNLRLGSGGVQGATDLFPELSPLLDRRAGLLSGGEQQMLVLGRALARRPIALLVDELSLGLAPLIVSRLLEVLRAAARENQLAVLLVEQQARRVLSVADRWYLLRNGVIVGEGDPSSGVGSLEAEFFSGAGATETPS